MKRRTKTVKGEKGRLRSKEPSPVTINKFRNPARRRALAVLTRMRKRGESLSKAARRQHTTPQTVLKYARRQLKRNNSGHYSIKGRNPFRRDVNVLGHDGYVPVTVHSPRKTHLASAHLIAVYRFLQPTGDARLLKPFVGKRVGGVELLTDPTRLREFAEADALKLDGLYRNQRGRQPR